MKPPTHLSPCLGPRAAKQQFPWAKTEWCNLAACLLVLALEPWSACSHIRSPYRIVVGLELTSLRRQVQHQPPYRHHSHPHLALHQRWRAIYLHHRSPLRRRELPVRRPIPTENRHQTTLSLDASQKQSILWSDHSIPLVPGQVNCQIYKNSGEKPVVVSCFRVGYTKTMNEGRWRIFSPWLLLQPIGALVTCSLLGR